MEQLLDYRIIYFDQRTHTISVLFNTHPRHIDIQLQINPLTNKYFTGKELHDYIMSFMPVEQKLPEFIKPVLNADEIHKLVDKKIKDINDIYNEKNKILILRESFLRYSDWTQLPDANKNLSKEDKIAWEDYRQKLRDITLQPGWPMNINWPKRPHILGVTIYE